MRMMMMMKMKTYQIHLVPDHLLQKLPKPLQRQNHQMSQMATMRMEIMTKMARKNIIKRKRADISNESKRSRKKRKEIEAAMITEARKFTSDLKTLPGLPDNLKKPKRRNLSSIGMIGDTMEVLVARNLFHPLRKSTKIVLFVEKNPMWWNEL